MGRCLEVYSIDERKLEEAVGHGDDKLRRMISGRFRTQIQSANDWSGWSNERGAPSVFEAIRELIMGSKQSIEDQMVYYYAYKFIVRFLGEPLDNSKFCPHRGDYLEEIQDLLRAHNATLSLDELTYGGALPGLKITPQFFAEVGYGYIPREVILNDEQVLSLGGRQQDPLDQIYGWLLHAKQREHVLVGFFTI